MKFTSTQKLLSKVEQIELQLRRIADMLEFFFETNYNLVVSPPPQKEKDDEELLYRNPEEIARQEIADKFRKDQGGPEDED